MTGEELKSALSAGERVWGTMLMKSRAAEGSDAVAGLGLDFVIVDNEHSPYSRAETAAWVRTLKKMNIVPFVRVPIPASHYVTMALDAGAQGILAPYVETVEEVREVVGAAKYLPLKGEAVRRIVSTGEFPSDATREHLAERNKNNLLVIGIESVVAVERLEELLSVPGVDGAFVGPNDLSIQLGVPADYEHPTYLDAVARIHETCKAKGVPMVVHFFSYEMAKPWIERGAHFILCGTDRDGIAQEMNDTFGKMKAL